MAKNTPVLTHQGKKWAEVAITLVIPIIGILLILAINWGVPDAGTSGRAEAYANRAKSWSDITEIFWGFVALIRLFVVSFVAYLVCALIFGTAHRRLFGEKAKVGLLSKFVGILSFLVLVYLFTK